MEETLRDFIDSDVRRELRDIDIAQYDWNSQASAQMSQQLYERAYEIMEAIQA